MWALIISCVKTLKVFMCCYKILKKLSWNILKLNYRYKLSEFYLCHFRNKHHGFIEEFCCSTS